MTPNVAAFLRVIRQGESNQTDSAYTLINGGGHFQAPPWKHPWHGIPTTQGARATGAYQFLGTTWARLNLPDFSPPNQDLGAVLLIKGRGALEDVEAGRFEAAVAKLRQEWTSLPGAAENNARWNMAAAKAVYLQYGGFISGDTQPAAPIEDRSTVASAADRARLNKEAPVPLLLSLIPSILQLFAPRAQAALEKVTGQPSDVVGAFASSLIGKVQELTGKADPIQAVAAATDTSVADHDKMVAELQEHALDYLDKLAPVLDKIANFDKQAWDAEEYSRSAAAERAKSQQETGPLYGNPTFIIACFVLLLVATVVCAVLFKGGFSTDMQAFVIGAIVGSALTAVLGFYFGSSRSSSAKDVLIGEMAKRSQQ